MIKYYQLNLPITYRLKKLISLKFCKTHIIEAHVLKFTIKQVISFLILKVINKLLLMFQVMTVNKSSPNWNYKQKSVKILKAQKQHDILILPNKTYGSCGVRWAPDCLANINTWSNSLEPQKQNDIDIPN